MATKKRAATNKLQDSIKKYIPEIITISGIFLVALSLSHQLLRNRSLRLDEQTVHAYVQQQKDEDPALPTHIFIPWNTDAEITQQVYVQGEWTVSPDKVSYLTSSGLPGQAGNIIMYGHNKRSILGNIRALKGGEEITLTLSNGVKRMYQVQKIAEVKPTDTALLLPTSTETLTLYTCSGPFDSLRFVVQAVPLPNQSLTPAGDPGAALVF